ncbi:MAG: phage virion morphogenesis protein [Bacteroidetes bacterium]|nr:phage virion morphogenesis protein [Bacteroidota bacterium]
MTSKEFRKYLQSKQEEIKKAMEETIPKKAANKAVLHFKKSFQDEGFTDNNLEKWQEVKRCENPKRADLAKAKLPVLTGTGDLGRSIKATTEPGKVTITSDLPYSSAHNEGTNNAGRNRNVVIPKRQFIGESETLNKEIEKVIVDELSKILKK